jgi:hypothetical protein
MDFESPPGGLRGCLGCFKDFQRRNRQREIVLQVIRDMRGQAATRHQDRFGDANFTQMNTLIQHSNPDGIHEGLNIRRHAINAMPISVGLEHHQHFGRGNFCTDGFNRKSPVDMACF